MELFYKSIGQKIVEINDVEFEGYTQSVIVKSFEKFIESVKDQNLTLEKEAEDTLNQLFTEDNEESTDINIQKYNIKHWISNRSFGEIIDMYLSGEILKPNMQREFVWNSSKCSRLIESIVLGLPIPPFFLLEIEKNKYEIIDGYQRITTLVNYVNGFPWNFDIMKYVDENDEIDVSEIKAKEKSRVSKLSRNVLKEISNKPFEKLDKEYQRMIKRSTIPLIEFNQVTPGNFESKYLIFERINTGSEKLNAMQIRKSLAYGDFIETLYKIGDSSKEFKSLFANASLKKDVHIEAYLRVMLMVDIYSKEYKPNISGMKNILNAYCEKNRDKIIDREYSNQFNQAFDIINEAFSKNTGDLFKRPDIWSDSRFIGNLNINILEVFMAILICKIKNQENYNKGKTLFNKYCTNMRKIVEDEVLNDSPNPFMSSPGSISSIQKRLDIFSRIV